MNHISVLIKEIINILNLQKKKVYIDMTLGDGGYTKALFEACEDIKVVAIEQNSKSLKRAKAKLKKYKDRILFVHSNFKNIAQIVAQHNIKKIDGIVYDLGLASWQIDEGEKGISFQKDELLDMRLDDSYRNITTASEILNKFPIKKIAEILYKYADVRGSWAIARRIDVYRKNKNIQYTSDLVNICQTKDPKRLAPIFQALRIYVNNEYDNLEQSLKSAIDVVSSEGKVIVVSYHSGEDRIVKNVFRNRKKEKNDIKILTKKPLMTSSEEININPRARSARMRYITKL